MGHAFFVATDRRFVAKAEGLEPTRMHRISMIGCSSSGKSTLAELQCGLLDAEQIELSVAIKTGHREVFSGSQWLVLTFGNAGPSIQSISAFF